MTLYERALKTEAASPVERSRSNSSISLLREQVKELISVDEIAELSQTNPSRARNEVRNACRRSFEDPCWAQTSSIERDAIVSSLIDAIFGFGPIDEMVEDPTITEIMINGPRQIFFERAGRIYPSDKKFETEMELRALIDRILGPLGRRVDESSPMVSARLPQGHRVNVVMPPISLIGPIVTIRKFASSVITLDDMTRSNTIDPMLRQLLIWAVESRKSIAVCGGTGSGKTTLLNALSCVIPHEERIVTIEDSAELRFLEHPHVISLEARPRNSEGRGEVSIRDLVTNALRMRPDRIVVGECRGAEALDMLQAMNTGHDGSLTTLHANSPEESISRLTTMVRYAAELPVDVIEANIAGAIDMVVQMQRSLDGTRRVSDVVSLRYDRARGRCRVQPIFQRSLVEERGRWICTPDWIDSLSEVGRASSVEVAAWKRRCLSA